MGELLGAAAAAAAAGGRGGGGVTAVSLERAAHTLQHFARGFLARRDRDRRREVAGSTVLAMLAIVSARTVPREAAPSDPLPANRSRNTRAEKVHEAKVATDPRAAGPRGAHGAAQLERAKRSDTDFPHAHLRAQRRPTKEACTRCAACRAT